MINILYMHSDFRTSSASEEDTHRIAQEFAARLQPGDVVALVGELGAGKTEFVRGLCKYFDVREIVASPTFTIMNVYHGHLPNGHPVDIIHLDLYRIKSKQELSSIGITECLSLPNAIKLVEWPEKANSAFLMCPHYRITINTTFDQNQRVIECKRCIPSTKQVISSSQT